MRHTTTMTVRVSGALSDFVAANVGETGAYESVSEYIRDLIRRDKARSPHVRCRRSLEWTVMSSATRNISSTGRR